MNSFILGAFFCLCTLLCCQLNAQHGDTAFKKAKPVDAVDFKSNKVVTITYNDGRSETISENEAHKQGLIHNGGYGNQKNSGNQLMAGEAIRFRNDTAKPLVVLDGKEVADDTLSKINPQSIESINVLKGKAASDQYGVKGRNGVIEITTKAFSNRDKESEEIREEKIVFEKVEVEPSVDKKKWQTFLETYLSQISEANQQDVPAGNYKVSLRFEVHKDGSLSDFKILKDPGHGLGQKVIEIMKYSPSWRPGEQNGRVVVCYVTREFTIVVKEGKASQRN